MYPHSITFNPKSPNDNSAPRHALPRMRPRCCLRYLTFFGINIKSLSLNQTLLLALARELPRLERSGSHCRRRLTLLLAEDLAFVNPSLHADHAICGPRFAESVIDIRTQGVQRQPPLQIPLRARNLVPVQPT